MLKIISLLAILSLLVSFSGLNYVLAQEFETKMTESGLTTTSPDVLNATTTEETDGSSPAAPLIKAVWAMAGKMDELSGKDDSLDLGAQFLPSGKYQKSKPISICSVVADENGSEDISQVLSKVYWPAEILGQYFEESLGCGGQKGEACLMAKLNKQDGIDLFCQNLQTNNPDLVTFYDIYNFSSICADAGELAEEKAAIYCCDQGLAYNDLAGRYKVLVGSKDKQEIESNIFEASFDYLELTAFEADFISLNYKEVVLNSEKIIEGDLIWNEPKGENQVTVRNVGNTRLKLDIKQNDMGLGKTDGEWNIRYGAKLGEGSLWQRYWPEENILLNKILELSGIDQLDFSIMVFKFLKNETNDYSGKMDINAHKAEDLSCLIER